MVAIPSLQGDVVERQVMSIIELALALRETLGIAHRPSRPEDAWLLAEYLREGVTVEITNRERPNGGCIRYMPSVDVPDVIQLSPSTSDPSRQALILAHELGHYLCTQPLRRNDLTSRENLRFRFDTEYVMELFAETFARAFLDVDFSDHSRSGPVRCGHYRESLAAAAA